MSRLRNKLLIFVLGLVVSAILGTAFFAAKTFVADKQDYVLELGSVATPNVAAAISNRLEAIHGQLVVFDEILKEGSRGAAGEVVQAAFRKLDGVERIDVFDAQGRLASIGTSDDPRAALEPGLRERSVRLVGDRLVFSAPVGAHLYLATLRKDAFAEYLDSARALSATWVTEEGRAILGAAGAPVAEVLAALKGQAGQSVIARELTLASGERWLAAASQVSGARGSRVVAMVPSVRASQMAGQVFQGLVPFIALILLLAVALGAIFSSQIVRPIEDLTAATSRIAEGDWKVVFTSKSHDEIGKLVAAFGRMGTELEKRETDLNEAHRALVGAERLAALGKFSAGLAHEVKNPLNSILGFAQLLERKMVPPTDETTAKYLKFIMDETKRADRIIADLLTFARQRPPTLARARVDDLLRRAAELFAPQAQAAGVKISLELGADPLAAELDSEQLYQVLLNLMANATHAMQESAEGTARVLRLHGRSEAGKVVIEVSDVGSGISEENLKRVFEPFFTTKGVGKGTGLGLALCHGIVQQHRGTIEVASQVGKGTTFTIRLPGPESQKAHLT